MMDREWHRLMCEVLERGEPRADRTGVGTLATFGARAEWDLREGFPACTTKKLYYGQVRAELAGLLLGAESLQDFNRLGCTIWDANGSDPRWVERQRFPGDVGRIYGSQWRRWRSVGYGRGPDNPQGYIEVDQLKRCVDGIRADPHGRRHLVSAWNPGELDLMCLPPCHVMFQFFASDQTMYDLGHGPRGSLDLQFHMRSLDLFIGCPFDVASYATILHLVARHVGRAPRRLVMTVGDCHIYNNHRAQAEEALRRQPRRLPTLELSDSASPFGFMPEDARLIGYDPHPPIAAPMNR